MIRHYGPISGISAHRNGYVATAGYDNKVILWDKSSNRSIGQGMHDHLVNHCMFSRCGNKLVSASSDHSARIWSVPDMKLIGVLFGHVDDVMQAKFSPDDTFIATCSYDGRVGLFDSAGNNLDFFSGHNGLIESIEWRKNSSTIVSCGTDATIREWDVDQRRQKSIRTIDGFDIDAIVSLDDDAMVSGDNRGVLTLWRNGAEPKAYRGHRSGVKRIMHNEETDQLLSMGYDQYAILWAYVDNELIQIKREKYVDQIWARAGEFIGNSEIVFSTFGSTFATWDLSENKWVLDNYSGSIALNAIDVHNGNIFTIGDSGVVSVNRKRTELGPRSLCNFIRVTGSEIYVGGQTGCLFDAKRGEVIYEHDAPLNCAEITSLNGQIFLVVGSYSGDILVLEVDSGKSSGHVKSYRLHENAIKSVAILRGQLYSGSADGEIAIFDLEKRKVVSKITNAHDGILNGICAYKEGVATVSRDLTLRLWEGCVPKIVKSRHQFSIKCIASDANGEIIATGSYGGTIDLFNVKSGVWIGDMKRPTMSGISSIIWDDHRAKFLASSYDGEVYCLEAE